MKENDDVDRQNFNSSIKESMAFKMKNQNSKISCNGMELDLANLVNQWYDL